MSPRVEHCERRALLTGLVSVNLAGFAGGGLVSIGPKLFGRTITPDGRYVLFQSVANDLVSNDTNTTHTDNDLFVRDLTDGTTTLVTVSLGNNTSGFGGVGGYAIGGAERVVAFDSNRLDLAPNANTGASNVYVRNVAKGTTTLVSANPSGSAGNSYSILEGLTPDGRYVLFQSNASDLVPGDTNDQPDLFFRDLSTGTITLVNVSGTDGISNAGVAEGASISDDGHLVAFASSASDLVLGDTNGTADIFVRDLNEKTTTLVSAAADGGASNNGFMDKPVLSPDGLRVAFISLATNLTGTADGNGTEDVFIRDLMTGNTTLVSVSSLLVGGNPISGNGRSFGQPKFSADGKKLAFLSVASDLVPDDTNGGGVDIFARDLVAGTTTRVATNFNPSQADGNVRYAFNASGRYLIFGSDANGLVAGDTDDREDAFVRDLVAGKTTLLDDVPAGSSAGSTSFPVGISADGSRIVFTSDASGLVPNDTNSASDVFVNDRTVPKRGVPGDFDSDGKTDLAVLSPTDSKILIRYSGGGYAGIAVASTPDLTTLPAPGDYDGDGKIDLIVFRASDAHFVGQLSGGTTLDQHFGATGLIDVPVPGDYDGDGKTDFAVFRVNTAEWLILYANGSGGLIQPFGDKGLSDVPVPGDYDGDGKTDLAVFRVNTAEWWCLLSGGGGFRRSHGATGLSDVPVPGDYDGDGKTDLAVFRTSTAEWLGLLSGGGGFKLPHGATGLTHVPIPASIGSLRALLKVPLRVPRPKRVAIASSDYDGDGISDLVVFRVATAEWIGLLSGGTVMYRLFGAAGTGTRLSDIPVPGDYDGDGKTDLAIYRPSTAQWLGQLSGGGILNHVFGKPNDLTVVPIPGDYDNDGDTDFGLLDASGVLPSGSAVWYTEGEGDFGGVSYTEVPAPGDYDGDGQIDEVRFNASTGRWSSGFLSGGSRLNSVFGDDGLITSGERIDIPVPGDYDGDGKTDLTVFRVGDGAWLIQLSSGGVRGVVFGAKNFVDLPAAAPLGPLKKFNHF